MLKAFIGAASLAMFGATASAQECGQSEDCGAAEYNGAASAGTQGSAMMGAIGSNVGLRFDTGADVASQASDEAVSPFSYWVSASARGFSGDTDGWQTEGVAGIDVYINDYTLGGGFLGYGRSSREVEFTEPTEVGATVAGVYLARLVGTSTVLYGYVGGGRADYDSDGEEIEGDRLMFGVNISTEIDRGGSVFVPFAKLVVAQDELPAFNGDSGFHPATTVVGRTATAGARWEYKDGLGGSELLPYVSLGVDYLQADPGNGLPTEETVAPRFEAGFSGPLGAGLLSLDLRAGKADEGTTDIGATATYAFGF